MDLFNIINKNIMPYKIFLFFIAAGLLNCFRNVQAQQPVTISIFNESTTIPYTTFINTPIHPGFQVGTEFNWKETKHIRLYPSISIGYIFHKPLFQGIYANFEIGFDFKTNFGLNLKSKLGVGYLHTFTTKQEFQFENGQYESRGDRGNSRVMLSLSFGLGYRLNKKESESPEIFMLYQSWIEYPYSPEFIPLMSHTNLHLGFKFYPFKFKKQQ